VSFPLGGETHTPAVEEGAVRNCEIRLGAAPASGWRRREVLALLSGAAAAPVIAPLGARAQTDRLPTVGFLGTTTPTVWSAFVAAFLQRLRELGWIDGKNMAIEYRWAEGRLDRVAEYAAEFVRRTASLETMARRFISLYRLAEERRRPGDVGFPA